MANYEPTQLENTTRDKLSLAIASEIAAGRGTSNGGVWLDATETINKVKAEYPHEYELCLDRGLDLAKDRAEVGPAAHFIMGGVNCDSNGASTVPGLFIAGESAGGLHGGNRLGNNALSECIVFGARAGLASSKFAEEVRLDVGAELPELVVTKPLLKKIEPPIEGHNRPHKLKEKIQHLLGQHVRVIRSKESLNAAKEQLKEVEGEMEQVRLMDTGAYSREILDFIEVGHMLHTAKAIVGAARLRKESRGAHYHSDYPLTDEEPYNTFVTLEKGVLNFRTKPVKGESGNGEASCKNTTDGIKDGYV